MSNMLSFLPTSTRDQMVHLAQTPLPVLLTQAGLNPVQVLIDPAQRVTFKSMAKTNTQDGDYVSRTVSVNPVGKMEHDWRGTSPHENTVSDGWRYNNVLRKNEHIGDVQQYLTDNLGMSLPMVGMGQPYNSKSKVDIMSGTHFAYAVFCIMRDMGVTAVPVGVTSDETYAFMAESYPAQHVENRLPHGFVNTYLDGLCATMKMIEGGTVIGTVKKTAEAFVIGESDEGAPCHQWQTEVQQVMTSQEILQNAVVPGSNLLILCQRLLVERLARPAYFGGTDTVPDEVLMHYPDLYAHVQFLKRERQSA